MIVDDKGSENIKRTTAKIPCCFKGDLMAISAPHRCFLESYDKTGDAYRQSLLFTAPAIWASTIEALPISPQDILHTISGSVLFRQG